MEAFFNDSSSDLLGQTSVPAGQKDEAFRIATAARQGQDIQSVFAHRFPLDISGFFLKDKEYLFIVLNKYSS
jgi:hypothetical protein